MKAVVVFIVALFFLFCFPFIRPVSAAVVINPISVDTLTPIIGDTFNLTASMSGALSGGNYYVKCRIGANTSSLNDGQTYNSQTSNWLDDTGAWVDMPQITVVTDGILPDSIKCRIKSSANDEIKIIFLRACLNSGNSCGTIFQSVNSLTLSPIAPTPTSTPTPTPTSTPTPTPSPTNTPTPTPTSTPTPTPTKMPTPTPSLTGTPTPASELNPLTSSGQEDGLQGSVLGKNTANELNIPPPQSDLISSQTKKPDKVFQGVIMAVGIALIAICVILTIRLIRKGELREDE